MTVQSPDDLPRLTDSDRRLLRWIGAGVVAAVVGIATLPWTLAVAERLDPFSASAIVVLAAVAFVAIGRRRGRASAGLRVAVVLVAVALLAGAAMFAACVASSCVR